MVEVHESASVFMQDMAGSRFPIAVAHGEGRAEFAEPADQEKLMAAGNIALGFVDNRGATANTYPANPNGSPAGITGI